MSENQKLEAIGALWVKSSERGDYLSIEFTDPKTGEKIGLIGYANKYKEAGDNRPDYRLFPKKQKPQT